MQYESLQRDLQALAWDLVEIGEVEQEVIGAIERHQVSPPGRP
jgi:hypothetical protein